MMQGVSNTIKIVFFCLYCKATPFKIPSRGVILLLTQFPLFITPHFSSACEEGKVRKLEERLHCVCVSNKEDVASNAITEGAQSQAVYICQCNIDMYSVESRRRVAYSSNKILNNSSFRFCLPYMYLLQ